MTAALLTLAALAPALLLLSVARACRSCAVAGHDVDALDGSCKHCGAQVLDPIEVAP